MAAPSGVRGWPVGVPAVTVGPGSALARIGLPERSLKPAPPRASWQEPSTGGACVALGAITRQGPDPR
jgi:hypothetical protein